jgi:hypothetical protein
MILEPMLVRSSIRGNAAAAKSCCLSQLEGRYVVGSVIFPPNLASFCAPIWRRGPLQ